MAVDRERIAELTATELEALNERTGGSAELYRRANRVLSGGVASSLSAARAVAAVPRARQRSEGLGRRPQRALGLPQRLRLDGPGPRASGDRRARSASATSWARTSPRLREDSIVVGEELARRFRLPKWRYTNSGSESTMDAIRIARGFTGRDTIMKIFGSYHGHHDAVMVSIGVEYDRIGPRERPASLPYGAGIPQAIVDLTHSVHFNDAENLDRRIAELDAEGRKPACVIMEAAMMNLGVVLPEPGYLEAVREITQRHGVVLIFDEVKTGICIAAGGAVERFGVVPDMVTLAKALGGGLPTGAIGMSRGALDRRRGRHRLPGRHVQRQSAGHGGGPREPARGDDARGLRAPRSTQRPHRRAAAPRSSPTTGSTPTPSVSARRAASRSRRSRSPTTPRSRRTRTPSCPSSRGCSTSTAGSS